MFKKTIYYVVVLLFSVGTVISQTIITRPGIGDCKLVFEDNFDGTVLNTEVWDYRTDTRFWSKQVPENVTVADGFLYLNVKQQNIGTTQYTGAGVITKKGYRYGYYESRFKIPKGKGWHTSFWMMYRTPSTGIPYSKLYQEIDVCENDSKSLYYYTTNLHNYSPVHTSSGGLGVSTPNLADNFHTWGCEFTPKEVKFFFEGNLVRTLDATKQPHGDASIWLTTIAAPLGGTDTVDVAKLPSAAVYDYVRFYEQLNPVFLDSAAINDSLKATPNDANPQIIIDNTDAGCTFSAPWTVSSGITGFYGTNYAYYSSTSSTTWAKWTPAIPEDGNYRIFMRWAAYSNRPTAAPVEIKHMEGTSTVKVNQTLDGGKWNFLGSYQLTAGNANYIKILCSGGINTIADAVLFEKIPAETSLKGINRDNNNMKIISNFEKNTIRAFLKLSSNSIASLQIYNTYGTLVNDVFCNKALANGEYNYDIRTLSMVKGMYISKLTVNGEVFSTKFIYQ
jgi:beta-glucanase (GH16 family)